MPVFGFNNRQLPRLKFEVPPSNVPRYLQFYDNRTDFFEGIL